ncbi:MAG: class I SAM-dependent methyltransferase [Alphaproteobacteria bacterium]
MDWRAFWNGRHSIYVNERHRAVHYARVADDIVAVLPGLAPVALDFGCGDALFAERVAARCARLYLCDAAPTVRERLAQRHAGNAKIAILAPDDVARLDDVGLDLVVTNSVLQYLTAGEFAKLAELWRRKLKPDGTLVLADILPPDDSLAADIKGLLAPALRHGFFFAALRGLAATFFSDYRRLRGTIGLTRYAEGDMIARLAALGFKAERRHPNFGFNARRMTFVARPAAPRDRP